ncbi:MAG: hypothetical protein ACODAQ_04320 [Phycisphaeraceae bacterium]
MSVATQDIFELTLARPVTLLAGEHPALVHLWWRCVSPNERLVQVYVDDELYDVTAEPEQREMWLVLDRAEAHRIELLAVPIDQAWRPQPEMLASWQPRVDDVARLTVLRDETLAVDAQVTVRVDGQPMDQAPLWPSDAHRGGFGGLFGEGGFGIDAATGPGLGVGEFGYGPLGADGTAWRWTHRRLEAGMHELSLTAIDHAGQPVADGVSRTVQIDRLAEPVSRIEFENDFTLRWS